VVDLVEKLEAFGNKLDLFHADLLSGRLLHFNTLKTVGEGNVIDKMKIFITQLKDNFSARFDDFFLFEHVLDILSLGGDLGGLWHIEDAGYVCAHHVRFNLHL